MDKKCFVGLRYSCDFSEPKSKIFLNDLEGMSLKRVSTVAGDENHRGEDLFKKLHDEAIENVCNDFTSKLSKHFNFNHTIQRRRIGFVGNSFREDDALPKGIILERRNDDLNQSLYIKSVSFNSDRKVEDAIIYIETPCSKEERKVNIKCGRNDIFLDIQSNEEYVIVYLEPCFKVADELINDCGCSNGCDQCFCSCGAYYGKLFTEVTENDRKHVANNGLRFDVRSKCDDTDLICEFAQELKYVVRMKIGIKVMTEVLVSDELHPLVRNGSDDAQLLLTKWQGGVNRITGFEEKSEYWRLLMPIVSKAKRYLESGNSACVSCNHSVGYFESVP